MEAYEMSYNRAKALDMEIRWKKRDIERLFT